MGGKGVGPGVCRAWACRALGRTRAQHQLDHEPPEGAKLLLGQVLQEVARGLPQQRKSLRQVVVLLRGGGGGQVVVLLRMEGDRAATTTRLGCDSPLPLLNLAARDDPASP